MEAIETKEIGNYRIKIFQDNDPESPREWSNLGTMICFHGRYNLGDKHDYDSDDYSGWNEMEKVITKNEDVLHILPLYLYDHSGITISTCPFSCRWDSGQIGYIYVSKKKVREEYGVKRINKQLSDKVLEVLEGEVKTYDQYLTGDIYGFKVFLVEKCDLGHEHEREMDSCWGFYGQEECMKEAEGVVGYNIEEEEKEAEQV